MSDEAKILIGLIGAAIGVIPALIGVIIPWLRNRDKTSQAMRDLDLAKKEVEFILAWLEAASSISDDVDRKSIQSDARSRLNSLMSASTETSESLLSHQIAHRKEKPRRKGSLLLFSYLGFYLFMLFGASIDDQNNVSLTHLIAEIFSEDGWIILIVFGLPLVFLFLRWYRSGRISA